MVSLRLGRVKGFLLQLFVVIRMLVYTNTRIMLGDYNSGGGKGFWAIACGSAPGEVPHLGLEITVQRRQQCR